MPLSASVGLPTAFGLPRPPEPAKSAVAGLLGGTAHMCADVEGAYMIPLLLTAEVAVIRPPPRKNGPVSVNSGLAAPGEGTPAALT